MGSGERGTGNLQNWEFLKVGIFKVGNLKKRESFNWESLKAGIFKMANLKNAESFVNAFIIEDDSKNPYFC